MPTERYGLQKVEIGAIAGDGGVSTVFAELGATVSDTCDFTVEKKTQQVFNIEQSEAPFKIISKGGKAMIKFQTYDIDPATMVKFFGGTVTQDDDMNDVYNAPASMPEIELSVRLTMIQGGVLTVVRANVNASLLLAASKTKLPSLDIEATILLPKKANTLPWSFNGKTVDGITAVAITGQPADATLSVGDNLYLSVTATGTGLSYQWKKDGVSINGATYPVYGKTNVQVGDAADYTCVVSNAKGAVTSDPATVAVS